MYAQYTILKLRPLFTRQDFYLSFHSPRRREQVLSDTDASRLSNDDDVPQSGGLARLPRAAAVCTRREVAALATRKIAGPSAIGRLPSHWSGDSPDVQFWRLGAPD